MVKTNGDKNNAGSKPKTQSVILTQNKVCKNCVRFGTTESSDVGSSFYLNNPGHVALGRPKKIRVSVDVAD